MNVAAEQGTVLKKRRRRDIIARIIISGFGAIVLLTMMVLIWHLFSEAISIARSPDAETNRQVQVVANGRFRYFGDVDSGQTVVIEGPGCRLTIASFENEQFTARDSVSRPCSHTLSVIQAQGYPFAADISSTGQVRLFPLSDTGSTQTVALYGLPLISELSFAVPEPVWAAQQSWQLEVGERWIIMAVNTGQTQHVQWVDKLEPAKTYQYTLEGAYPLLLLPDSLQIAQIREQELVFYNQKNQQINSMPIQPVTKGFSLVKNRSLLLSHPNGTVSRYTVFNDKGTLRYQQAYELTLRTGEEPVAFYPHPSVNGLAAVTNQQQLLLINRISGQIVERRTLPFQPTGVSWFDNRVYVFSEHTMAQFKINHLAGLSTANSLFQPQLYEGYEQSDFVWQTTSASDYQESKMNLVPLLIGSLKASGLALLIALPLAFGAAVYTAYFAHYKIREFLKPAIELLEAIPSVLIGFIAAIWLAPLAERYLIAFAILLITLPVCLLLVAFIQHKLASRLPSAMRSIAELLLPVVGISALGYLCIEWAGQWLMAVMGIFDASVFADASDVPVGKTTILVAIALGFAISPSIYSLAEDAISGVPASLRQASYALGATRLQTLHRVVLRVAFPGIMAAIMLGFGRAFGETMIVLMVTGNTPIADWDLLAGLRALTANLAIELPEAKVNSIHYKVLFLTACLLFLFTFVVNTLAELLRQRARKATENG